MPEAAKGLADVNDLSLTSIAFALREGKILKTQGLGDYGPLFDPHRPYQTSTNKRLSAGPCPPNRVCPQLRRTRCQALLLGLSFNLYRLKHRRLFLKDVNRAR
jgi:hypothetical protein